jgi:hypothetical protein
MFVEIKKQKAFLITLIVMLGISSCSSPQKKSVEDQDQSSQIKKDYEVRDASSSLRPGWIVDAIQWASTELKDTDKYHYYSHETTPKVDRDVACALAKSSVRVDIASEIATFIENKLGQSREGSAAIDENHPQSAPLREFIEVTLAEKTQAMLHGVSIVKTYWEKRQYLQSEGATKDYKGYTCAVLARIDHDVLKKAVNEASEKVIQKVDDPSTKENVKKALENVSENFVKSKQGQI